MELQFNPNRNAVRVLYKYQPVNFLQGDNHKRHLNALCGVKQLIYFTAGGTYNYH
jgi:hypothetical protein